MVLAIEPMLNLGTHKVKTDKDGWTVRKDIDKYIFTKNHRNTKEVYLDSYLKQFLSENFDLSKVMR